MKRALALIAFATASCGRAHLEPGYGASYHAQFAAQRERPGVVKKAAAGLDPQEASIIATSYRKSLTPKDERDMKESPILVLAPQQGGMTPQLPPPSVPKE